MVAWQALALEPSPVDRKIYETAIGGSKYVVLNSAITMQLNTNTRLRTSVAGTGYAVTIDRGEAFFQVGGNPLQVVVRDVSISAINTSFSVRDYGNNHVDIVPLHGSVHIDTARQDRVDHVVSAGQRAAVHAGEFALQNLGYSTIQRKLTWRYGMLEFVNETVDSAVSEFNRYNRTRLIVDDPAIGRRRIGGRFSSSDTEVFVATMSRVFDMHIEKTQTPSGAVIHLGRMPMDAATNTSRSARQHRSADQKE